MDYTWTKLYYGFIFLGDRNKCHVAMGNEVTMLLREQ